MLGWTFNTDWGAFAIAEVEDGGPWSIVFDGQGLGIYSTAEAALLALVSAQCQQPAGSPPTDEIGFPDSLADWDPIPS